MTMMSFSENADDKFSRQSFLIDLKNFFLKMCLILVDSFSCSHTVELGDKELFGCHKIVRYCQVVI